MKQGLSLAQAERRAGMTLDEASDAAIRSEVDDFKKYIGGLADLDSSVAVLCQTLFEGGARAPKGEWVKDGVPLRSDDAKRFFGHLARKYSGFEAVQEINRWFQQPMTNEKRLRLFEYALMRGFYCGVDFARGNDAKSGRKRKQAVREVWFSAFDDALQRSGKSKTEIRHKEIVQLIAWRPMKKSGQPYSNVTAMRYITEWLRI